MQAGLNLAVKLADRVRRERPNAYNYIILMSDGVANVDATDPFAILESASDGDSSNPLRLITIGVGIENYNDYLLEQLAQHGNGWYRYLSNTEQARATFSRDNWLALSIPFADQTRAQVTWDPDVVEGVAHRRIRKPRHLGRVLHPRRGRSSPRYPQAPRRRSSTSLSSKTMGAETWRSWATSS